MFFIGFFCLFIVFLPFLTTSHALEMGILLQFCSGERKEVQGYDSKAFLCWRSLYWCNRSLSGLVSENAEFFPDIVYLDVS